MFRFVCVLAILFCCSEGSARQDFANFQGESRDDLSKFKISGATVSGFWNMPYRGHKYCAYRANYSYAERLTEPTWFVGPQLPVVMKEANVTAFCSVNKEGYCAGPVECIQDKSISPALVRVLSKRLGNEKPLAATENQKRYEIKPCTGLDLFYPPPQGCLREGNY